MGVDADFLPNLIEQHYTQLLRKERFSKRGRHWRKIETEAALFVVLQKSRTGRDAITRLGAFYFAWEVSDDPHFANAHPRVQLDIACRRARLPKADIWSGVIGDDTSVQAMFERRLRDQAERAKSLMREFGLPLLTKLSTPNSAQEFTTNDPIGRAVVASSDRYLDKLLRIPITPG